MDDSTDSKTLIHDNAARFAAQSSKLGLLGRGPLQQSVWLAALAEGGWTGLRVNEDADGSGLSTYDLAIVAHEFGRKLLPSFVPLASALGVLGEARSEPIRDAFAIALAGGSLVLPALQSEGQKPSPGHGSRLRRDGADLVLDGVKVAVPHGDAADGFFVDASIDGVLALVFVPHDAVGLTITSQDTIDGGALARLQFNAMRLPASHLLASGAGALSLLDRVRFSVQLGLAAEAIGAASEAFDRALEHLRTRRAFGRTLGAFQALQHRAVDTSADLEIARAFVMEAARVADHAQPGTLALVSAARAKAGDCALKVAKWAIQMHGGMGFADECDIGLFYKRIIALTRQYRTPEQHRARFADWSWSEEAVDLAALFHSESEDEKKFRAEVRAFIEKTLPARLRDLPTRPKPEDGDWWHRQLYERGWIAPSWPKEHGGMEASVEQRLILFEELALAGTPELSGQGINHIGPILIRYGTPAQKARLLPGTLSGEVRWCQGYSEPNAGSDLASLRTSGRVEGDKVIINGQKIWTSNAHLSDWMFALIRTDPNAEDRRNGISMILIDMQTKGLRVRPFCSITGEEEFAEVFFDNVEVPIENVVSGLNEGWKLANAVLENERFMTSSPQRVILVLDRVRRVAKETGASADPAFRDRLARAEIDVLAFSATFARVLSRVRLGETAGNQASFLKIINADLQQTLADLMLDAAGSDGANIATLPAGGRNIAVGLSVLQVRRATIYGGTSEIQRNIVARRVLDLGNEPRKPSGR